MSTFHDGLAKLVVAELTAIRETKDADRAAAFFDEFASILGKAAATVYAGDQVKIGELLVLVAVRACKASEEAASALGLSGAPIH